MMGIAVAAKRWMGSRRCVSAVDFRVVGRKLVQVRVPIQVVQ